MSRIITSKKLSDSRLIRKPSAGGGVSNIAYIRDQFQPTDNDDKINGSHAWYKTNTTIFDQSSEAGIIRQLDPNDNTKLSSKTPNVFGTTTRVTNDKGAQNYIDVGGGLTSDGATAGVMVDHYTSKIWLKDSLHAGTLNWQDSHIAALTHTVTAFDGSVYGSTDFTQFHMPTPKDIQHILTGDSSTNIFNGIENWADSVHFVMFINTVGNCGIWRDTFDTYNTNQFGTYSRTTVNAGIDCILCANWKPNT